MSYCSCVYAPGCDDGLPSYFWPRQPVARKEHKCYECGHFIQPGERYHHDSGKWEGGFYAFKVCATCREITDAFFCEGFTYGGVIGNLYSHIQEHNGQISEKCIASLSPAARASVCDLIEDYWRLSELELSQI